MQRRDVRCPAPARRGARGRLRGGRGVVAGDVVSIGGRVDVLVDVLVGDTQRAGGVGVLVPRVGAGRARHGLVSRPGSQRQTLRELGRLVGRDLLRAQLQTQRRNVKRAVLADRQRPGRGVDVVGVIGEHQRDGHPRVLSPHRCQQPLQALLVAGGVGSDQQHVRRPHIAGRRGPRIKHTDTGLTQRLLHGVHLLGQLGDRGVEVLGVGQPVRVEIGQFSTESDQRHLQHL